MALSLAERGINPAQNNDRGFENPSATMGNFYTGLYKTKKSDSTEHSRTTILRKSHPYLSQLGKDDWVLDLGSGPQILPRQYSRSYGKPQFHFVTLDRAHIDRERLLGINSPRMHHVRADGIEIPLADNSISFVLSNMALEYMPEKSIEELYRVLKQGGAACINIWTKRSSWAEVDNETMKKIYGKSETKRGKADREFWQEFLSSKVNGYLGEKKNVIKETLENYGFIVKNMTEVRDENTHESWWEVELRKPSTATERLMVKWNKTRREAVSFTKTKLLPKGGIFVRKAA